MAIELLAPAGNLEKLKIAFSYGADAVYLAGQEFGLRSAADNFTLEEIQKALAYTKKRKKKLYLVLNAILHSEEIGSLLEYVDKIGPLKPDALICSDIGVIEIIASNFDIPIHISTQASTLNQRHAEIYKAMGAKRIVAARELSIKEAGQIGEKSGLEMELFVHGALCMAYSGNCVISNYVAGRDSNRGGCIQNCRYGYTFSGEQTPLNLMSSKDIAGINLLGEFIKNKIASLKVEGRMKSGLYLATTIRAYFLALRRLKSSLDADLSDLEKELKKIPHRDYTEASLARSPGNDSVYRRLDELSPGYVMAGTIVKVDEENNRFLIHSKNKLALNDQLEILTFGDEIIKLEITQMKNVLNQPLNIVQPQALAWLPLDIQVKENMVIRKISV